MAVRSAGYRAREHRTSNLYIHVCGVAMAVSIETCWDLRYQDILPVPPLPAASAMARLDWRSVHDYITNLIISKGDLARAKPLDRG